MRAYRRRWKMGYRSMPHKTKVAIINVTYRPVDLAIASLVVTNGHTLRVTIPMKQARAFDIRAGDEVMMKITGVNRERES